MHRTIEMADVHRSTLIVESGTYNFYQFTVRRHYNNQNAMPFDMSSKFTRTFNTRGYMFVHKCFVLLHGKLKCVYAVGFYCFSFCARLCSFAFHNKRN